MCFHSQQLVQNYQPGRHSHRVNGFYSSSYNGAAQSVALPGDRFHVATSPTTQVLGSKQARLELTYRLTPAVPLHLGEGAVSGGKRPWRWKPATVASACARSRGLEASGAHVGRSKAGWDVDLATAEGSLLDMDLDLVNVGQALHFQKGDTITTATTTATRTITTMQVSFYATTSASDFAIFILPSSSSTPP